MAINGEYIRGDMLEVKDLFKEEKVSNKVLDIQESIPEKVKNLNEILSDSGKEPKY